MSIITFDCWGTLLNKSDQLTIEARRLAAFVAALTDHGYCRSSATVSTVIWAERAEAEHRQVRYWFDTTPEVQVHQILRRLDVPIDAAIWSDCLHAYTTTVLDLSPGVIDGAVAVVAYLAERHRLGLICNTGVTPGHVLRKLLRREGLYTHFTQCYFSNEGQRSKPDPSIFRQMVAALGSRPEHTSHVGDDLRTDVLGSRMAGVRPIWLRHGRAAATDGVIAIDSLSELLSIDCL